MGFPTVFLILRKMAGSTQKSSTKQNKTVKLFSLVSPLGLLKKLL